MVLAQRLHGQETGKLRRRLNFGQTPFGATKHNQNPSNPGRSRISVVRVLPQQRVCHSECRKESARSRSGHNATLTATIPEGAAMIGEARNQDRPLTNPKAAERNVQIPLQTVRTRSRLSLSSPRAFERTRTHKKQLILH